MYKSIALNIILTFVYSNMQQLREEKHSSGLYNCVVRLFVLKYQNKITSSTCWNGYLRNIIKRPLQYCKIWIWKQLCRNKIAQKNTTKSETSNTLGNDMQTLQEAARSPIRRIESEIYDPTYYNNKNLFQPDAHVRKATRNAVIVWGQLLGNTYRLLLLISANLVISWLHNICCDGHLRIQKSWTHKMATPCTAEK